MRRSSTGTSNLMVEGSRYIRSNKDPFSNRNKDEEEEKKDNGGQRSPPAPASSGRAHEKSMERRFVKKKNHRLFHKSASTSNLDDNDRSFSTLGGLESIQPGDGEDRDSLQPDVILYIGGKEFDEHSFLLRHCSEYFEREIAKNLREGVSWPMYFDFPNRDPKHWEVIREVIRPFPTKTITLKNLKFVLPWMDELSIPKGLEVCDHVLFEQLGGKYLKEIAQTQQQKDQDQQTKEDRLEQLQEYVHLILDGLVTATEFELRTSKGFLLSIIKTIIPNHPILLKPHDCGIIAKLVVKDDECRQELWSAIKLYLADYADSTTVESKPILDKMGLEQFQQSLYYGIQTHQAVSELNGVEKRALNWLRRKPRSSIKEEDGESNKKTKKKSKGKKSKEEEKKEEVEEFESSFDLQKQLAQLQQLERL